MGVFDEETVRTRRLYNRAARIYNLCEGPAESRFEPMRRRVWAEVTGPSILEVGVGTGKNFPFYPPGAQVTAIDLSDRMLLYAQRYAKDIGSKVRLLQMDAQYLDFPDNSFDSVVSTLVFCTVPHPVQGLREARRVCKPDGCIVLLEHVRPGGLLGFTADLVSPLSVSVFGEHLNRHTVDAVRQAGLDILRVDDLGSRVFRLIVAKPGK
jgi:ubiquinone/menaquinone biosynthesis C-methylase UbiE